MVSGEHTARDPVVDAVKNSRRRPVGFDLGEGVTRFRGECAIYFPKPWRTVIGRMVAVVLLIGVAVALYFMFGYARNKGEQAAGTDNANLVQRVTKLESNVVTPTQALARGMSDENLNKLFEEVRKDIKAVQTRNEELANTNSQFDGKLATLKETTAKKLEDLDRQAKVALSSAPPKVSAIEVVKAPDVVENKTPVETIRAEPGLPAVGTFIGAGKESDHVTVFRLEELSVITQNGPDKVRILVSQEHLPIVVKPNQPPPAAQLIDGFGKDDKLVPLGINIRPETPTTFRDVWAVARN